MVIGNFQRDDLPSAGVVVQDSVIALAIALEHAANAHQGGRILGIYHV